MIAPRGDVSRVAGGCESDNESCHGSERRYLGGRRHSLTQKRIPPVWVDPCATNTSIVRMTLVQGTRRQPRDDINGPRKQVRVQERSTACSGWRLPRLQESFHRDQETDSEGSPPISGLLFLPLLFKNSRLTSFSNCRSVLVQRSLPKIPNPPETNTYPAFSSISSHQIPLHIFSPTTHPSTHACILGSHHSS
jgi:hypothetical protein